MRVSTGELAVIFYEQRCHHVFSNAHHEEKSRGYLNESVVRVDGDSKTTVKVLV